jgi:hypothetical protein
MSGETHCVFYDTKRSRFAVLEIRYLPLKILWLHICYMY